jgi:hypothetical protein
LDTSKEKEKGREISTINWHEGILRAIRNRYFKLGNQ